MITLIKLIFSVLFLLLLSASNLAFSQQGITKLSAKDCKTLQQHNVITKSNPIPCSRLAVVTFNHVDEHGIIHDDGQLVVLDVIANQVAKLTAALTQQGFMIEKARPMERYLGDDQRSMADNNTSAFNGRAITNGKRWSLHAYGVTIDANPVQNPFIDIAKNGTAVVSPAQSARYAMNRLNERVGKLPRQGMAEDVVDLFALHGFFIWGGDWNYPIDYQHFQVGPRRFIERLVSLPQQQARVLLEQKITLYRRCQKESKTMKKLKRRAHCANTVIQNMKKSHV